MLRRRPANVHTAIGQQAVAIGARPVASSGSMAVLAERGHRPEASKSDARSRNPGMLRQRLAFLGLLRPRHPPREMVAARGRRLFLEREAVWPRHPCLTIED